MWSGFAASAEGKCRHTSPPPPACSAQLLLALVLVLVETVEDLPRAEIWEPTFHAKPRLPMNPVGADRYGRPGGGDLTCCALALKLNHWLPPMAGMNGIEPFGLKVPDGGFEGGPLLKWRLLERCEQKFYNLQAPSQHRHFSAPARARSEPQSYRASEQPLAEHQLHVVPLLGVKKPE